jgi:hypothetical protein
VRQRGVAGRGLAESWRGVGDNSAAVWGQLDSCAGSRRTARRPRRIADGSTLARDRSLAREGVWRGGLAETRSACRLLKGPCDA